MKPSVFEKNTRGIAAYRYINPDIVTHDAVWSIMYYMRESVLVLVHSYDLENTITDKTLMSHLSTALAVDRVCFQNLGSGFCPFKPMSKFIVTFTLLHQRLDGK